MIIVDSGSLGASCLQYAAANVLQRAGYSVWTDNNPCLEGLRMTVVPDTDFSLTRARFTGFDSNWSQDVSGDVDLHGDRMTLQDVQALVAKLIASPGFRKMAQTVSASESAGRFDIEPIRQADIRRSCGDRWPSKPFTVE